MKNIHLSSCVNLVMQHCPSYSDIAILNTSTTYFNGLRQALMKLFIIFIV